MSPTITMLRVKIKLSLGSS